jgi:dienelactone hydrolase
MKFSLSLLLLTVLTSCGHFSKTKNYKDTYSPSVSFTEGEKKFEAKVQLPKVFTDKLPLVVIVHEWWGRNEYMATRSEMLNKEGFATLAVDLFGDSKVVETPSEAQALATPFYQNAELGVSRLSKYIEIAKKDPHVDANKIFVIGYCFGGTQALNLARSGADIKGVVSFHGGLSSSITSKGIKAKVLAINGLADPMVPAKERTGFEIEMKNLKVNFKVINYKDATHAFTNPKATEIGKKYKIPVAYNKKADQNSWNDLLVFLKM